MSVREEVVQFSELMEFKLKKNDHKTSWRKTSDPGWFFKRLLDEVEELRQALESGEPVDIMEEAADVANFAMMIYDIHKRSGGGFRDGTCDNELEQAEGDGLSGQVRLEEFLGRVDRG